MKRVWRLFAAAFAALFFMPAHAQPGQGLRVQATLVSERTAIAPGETVALGLHQAIEPGWHTYWVNPGDAGEAPAIEWTRLEGFSVGEFQWPAPSTYITGVADIVIANHVYEREVILPFALTAPADLAVGRSVTLEGRAFWLVCNDSVCIPEEGPVSITLATAEAGADDPIWKPRLEAVRAAAPRPWEGVEAAISQDGRLSVGGGALAALLAAGPVRAAHFYPFDRQVVDHNLPQSAEQGAAGLSFALAPGPAGPLGQSVLSGVVAFDVREGGRWTRRGLEVAAQPGPSLPATRGVSADGARGEDVAAPRARQADLGLPLAILFAFLGGLVLNVMPCVFPILSIKALSLASGAGSGQARRHGALFMAGVLVTFLGLAGVLVALQAGGAQLGWGFQLQEPLFMGGLSVLFFLIGLNLLGAFDLAGGFQNLGAGLAGRTGDAGAFFTGLLAVVAATPCTAPFMASALGFAAAQPPVVALCVFAALGVGFAAPFTALSFAPGLQRLLPRPGPWMERTKQAFAFPMFAAAAWAAWVMSAQTGASGVLALLMSFVAAGFLVWALKTLRRPASRVGAALVAGLVMAGVAFTMQPSKLTPEPWSPARVEELRGQGRAVFVNFTADWCVSCKVNERAALSSSRIARAFAAQQIAYLEADWTNRDEAIAAALAAYGRTGVPLYLYYPEGRPGEGPIVLPQLLTEAGVLEAIGAPSPF